MKSALGAMEKSEMGAVFSHDRVYRYQLWRTWGEGPRLMVVGLNPSTADETVDDPTIRRCIGYAKRWGFAGLEMLNLFPLRATDPRELKILFHAPSLMQAKRSLHERMHNSGVLCESADRITRAGGAILAAWGANPWACQVSPQVRSELALFGMACLGLTKSGEPKHPLYLRADATPIPYLGDGGRLCARWWDEDREPIAPGDYRYYETPRLTNG